MYDRATCEVCGTRFVHNTKDDDPTPATCGRMECRNRHGWTDDEWAGAARMATARQDAGVPLAGLDEEALARA